MFLDIMKPWLHAVHGLLPPYPHSLRVESFLPQKFCRMFVTTLILALKFAIPSNNNIFTIVWNTRETGNMYVQHLFLDPYSDLDQAYLTQCMYFGNIKSFMDK